MLVAEDQGLSVSIGSADLCELLGISRSLLSTWRAAGLVGPQPLVGGTDTDRRHPKWSEAEIRAWLNNRTPQGKLYNREGWLHAWPVIRKQMRQRQQQQG